MTVTDLQCRDTTMRDEFGQTIWDAIEAFTDDPSYLAEMVESANLIDYKRTLWEVRAEAIRQAETPDMVPDIMAAILKERGITAPTKKQTGRNRTS